VACPEIRRRAKSTGTGLSGRGPDKSNDVEYRTIPNRRPCSGLAGDFSDSGRLGPTKSRKLVEHFGGPEAVFRASLTELEATGIQAVSAQSPATGKSAELAREEMARASAEGASVISLDDPCYPPRLKEIYPPSSFMCAEM
jgi:hypothetical protein